jgi:hypothetical protein
VKASLFLRQDDDDDEEEREKYKIKYAQYIVRE